MPVSPDSPASYGPTSSDENARRAVKSLAARPELVGANITTTEVGIPGDLESSARRAASAKRKYVDDYVDWSDEEVSDDGGEDDDDDESDFAASEESSALDDNSDSEEESEVEEVPPRKSSKGRSTAAASKPSSKATAAKVVKATVIKAKAANPAAPAATLTNTDKALPTRKPAAEAPVPATTKPPPPKSKPATTKSKPASAPAKPPASKTAAPAAPRAAFKPVQPTVDDGVGVVKVPGNPKRRVPGLRKPAKT